MRFPILWKTLLMNVSRRQVEAFFALLAIWMMVLLPLASCSGATESGFASASVHLAARCPMCVRAAMKTDCPMCKGKHNTLVKGAVAKASCDCVAPSSPPFVTSSQSVLSAPLSLWIPVSTRSKIAFRREEKRAFFPPTSNRPPPDPPDRSLCLRGPPAL